MRLAGIPEIPLHGARHSYAELALSSGVRLDVVSRALGHASSSFTADQYSHDSDDAAAKAGELVARDDRGRVALGGILGEWEGAGQHRPLSLALVDLVAGTGFEPVTSGL